MAYTFYILCMFSNFPVSPTSAEIDNHAAMSNKYMHKCTPVFNKSQRRYVPIRFSTAKWFTVAVASTSTVARAQLNFFPFSSFEKYFQPAELITVIIDRKYGYVDTSGRAKESAAQQRTFYIIYSNKTKSTGETISLRRKPLFVQPAYLIRNNVYYAGPLFYYIIILHEIPEWSPALSI